MDRLGVQLDQTLLDRQGMIPSSKGLISTTELIFYLANRHLDRTTVNWEFKWWSIPDKPSNEGPLRNRLTGKD